MSERVGWRVDERVSKRERELVSGWVGYVGGWMGGYVSE